MADVLERNHTKKKGGKGVPPPPPPVAVDVDVTPVLQCGQMVICDLEPTPGGNGGIYITDGVLFLVAGNTYLINFQLKNGPLGQFSWDVQAVPFWAKKSKCPTQSGMPPGQFPSAPSVVGAILTVGANGVRGRSAVHFRLNMRDPANNAVFCDPIIINN